MTVIADPQDVRSCCTSLYEHELTGWLLGNSFHPGAGELTDRLAAMIGVSARQRVLDVAAGPGTSALRIASGTGARIHGVDASGALVKEATTTARRCGLADRVTFGVADAAHLPFADDAVDAVICECALCIFSDKVGAAREMSRVVRPGGRVGVADVVLDRRRLPAELDTLIARVACLADARTVGENVQLLDAEGVSVDEVERHDEALLAMIDGIDARLTAARIAFPEIGESLDASRVQRHVALARDVVEGGDAGYVLIAATVPGASHGN